MSNAEFIEIIGEAVAADPRNGRLRVDLIELLLAERPRDAAGELRRLQAERLVDEREIRLLRARAAAAFALHVHVAVMAAVHAVRARQ